MFGLEDTGADAAMRIAKKAYIAARCEMIELSLGIANNSDGMRDHREAVAGAEFEYRRHLNKPQKAPTE